jgi:hypothetical protein
MKILKNLKKLFYFFLTFYYIINKEITKMAEKLKAIKEAIKNGTYNWEEAIESATSKIIENPEVLLWR